MDHHIVEIGTGDWYQGWGILLILCLSVLYLLPRLGRKGMRSAEKVWALLLFLSWGLEQVVLIRTGNWDATWALPLQLCSLSGMLTIFTLITRNKWTYLFVLFWGISGGLHSFLTPEMTLGGQGVLFFTYIFWHSSIIAMPLYFFFQHKWGIPRNAFLIVWGWTHFVWLAVGILDYTIGANYMYVMEPPLVDNPFVQGAFPYHLIGFEIAGILHFGLTHLVFRKLQKIKSIGESPIWLSA
ncbi:YwaF family protein [Phaeocystidibacter luteus]|uniref:YwaF family protein n=1 Tax=Phaeocystidibacter luteus TaxID=911197 RepID=UPI001478BC11|nr:TIGR02206 family membrane protein [Phaeocystidibacter luteus]